MGNNEKEMIISNDYSANHTRMQFIFCKGVRKFNNKCKDFNK